MRRLGLFGAVPAAAAWLSVSLLAFVVAFAIGAGSTERPAEATEAPAPAPDAVVLERASDTMAVPELKSAARIARLLPPPRRRPAPRAASRAPAPAPAPTPAPESSPEPAPAPSYSPPPASPPPAPAPTARPTPAPETFDSVGEEFDSPG